MNEDLGQDEQWERHEEARVHFQVLHERERYPSQDLTLERRQREQRHPGEQHEADEAPPQEAERRAEHPGAQVELVQRPAEDERELGFRGLHRPFAKRRTTFTSSG